MTQKPDAYEDFRDWPDDDEIFFDDDDFLIDDDDLDIDDDPWNDDDAPLGQEMMPCAQKTLGRRPLPPARVGRTFTAKAADGINAATGKHINKSMISLGKRTATCPL